jgi:hypothetical protein
MNIIANMLEQQYPDIVFDLHIGHTSIIYALNDDPKLDDIIRFCKGFVAGWESATE